MTIGIDCQLMFLIDNWPGEATPGANPSDWTTLSASEDYPLGTKRQVYDDTQNGWSTLMYLRYEKGTAALATVGQICGIDTTLMATAGQHCYITNDGGEIELNGPVAICLGTMVDDRYGWFWVGGVCPVTVVAALATSLSPSDSSPTTGNYMTLVDSSALARWHLADADDIQNFSAFAMVDSTTA